MSSTAALFCTARACHCSSLSSDMGSPRSSCRADGVQSTRAPGAYPLAFSSLRHLNLFAQNKLVFRVAVTPCGLASAALCNLLGQKLRCLGNIAIQFSSICDAGRSIKFDARGKDKERASWNAAWWRSQYCDHDVVMRLLHPQSQTPDFSFPTLPTGPSETFT